MNLSEYTTGKGQKFSYSKSEFYHPPTARVMVEAKKKSFIKPNQLNLVMHSKQK